MHVGVLLKIYAPTKEEARNIAINLLFQEKFCYRDVEQEYDVETEEGNNAYNDAWIDLNENANWDYPYGIKNDGEFFWDGKTEDKKFFSGMSWNDFLKGKAKVEDIFDVFEFYGSNLMQDISDEEGEVLPIASLDIEDETFLLKPQEEDNCWLFIGTVHI